MFRAHDPELGRDVAIKLLRPAASPSALTRFEREANALARLRHPHVLAIHGMGSVRGQPYLVLPLAETSLGDRIEREGPLDSLEAVQVGAKVARALEHVHAAGLLHRDLKPDNLLWLDGEPVLADFGLIKDLVAPDDHLSVTGAMLGSPGYWSPEQARGDRHALGPATDLYSLGATLFALLTGVPPHSGDSVTEVAQATLHQEPPRPSKLRVGISRELEALILRCLAKAPADRPPSAGAVARALEELAQEDRVAPRQRRAPWVVGAAAGLLAAGGLGYALTRPAPGAPWVADAEAALLRGDVRGLGVILDAAREADPANPRPWVLSARRWLDLDDPLQAQADAERALALAPDDRDARRARAEVDQVQGALLRALAEVEALLATDPEDAASYRLQSRALDGLTRPEAAVAAAERAVALEPDTADSHLALGLALLGADQPEAALAAAERARALAPDAPRGFMLLARAQLQAGDGAGALTAADALVARHPDYPGAFVLRGLVRQQLGDLAGARQDVERGLELAPRSPRAWAARGALAWVEGDVEAALADYGRALELAPTLGSVRAGRAAVYATQQDHAASLRDYDVLLDGDPETATPTLYSLRAATRVVVGDFAGAVADYRTITAKDPENVMAWEALSTLEGMAGHPLPALAAMDRAIELEPSATRLVNRATLHERQRDLDAARADLERALTLEPDHAGARKALQRLGQ